MKAIDDYLAALHEIKSATLSEKIVWKRNQTNTYTFKTINHDLEDLILTLRRMESSNGSGFDYLFSLVKADFDNSEILLSLDTSTNDSDLKETLCELYSFVEYHVDIKNLDGLKDFIETVNNRDTNGTILD